MTQWRAESERWRKACDKSESELRTLRGLVDSFRAFLRNKGMGDEFAEFLLAAHLGEGAASKLLEQCKKEREQNTGPTHAPNP